MGDIWNIKEQYKRQMGNLWSRGTRGVIPGGYRGDPSAKSNVIDYITIPTLGDAADFGDLTVARAAPGSTASNTRATVAAGFVGPSGGNTSNVIDSFEMQSTGNAADFGDATVARQMPSAFGHSTRGVCCGGRAEPGGNLNTLDHWTIASVGNAIDFGDLTQARRQMASLSSPTRGVIAGGYVSARVDVIDYITINSLGDATDFGDLIAANSTASPTGSNVRGVLGEDMLQAKQM